MSGGSPCTIGAMAVVAMLLAAAPAWAQASPPPQPTVAEGPNITVLKGLLVPQFEVEMRHYVEALGVNCGGCHVPRNFASEDNPRKAIARRMIEMTRQLNTTYFPDFVPAEGQSTLGRVTCYTCHQGETQPLRAPATRPR